LSDKLNVSEETKSRLKTELEKENERARKYIRRHVRFRRTIILLTIQTVVFIPYVFGVYYFLAPSNLHNDIKDLMLILSIPYMVVAYLISIFLLRRRLRHTCKLTCLYASVSAAQSLEKGNIVEGSFFITKLCEFLKTFAEEERVQIGHFPSSIKKLFLGNIEKLHEQRTAVGKAVMENRNLSFRSSNYLYILADSLFSLKKEPNYDEANEALRFFIKSSEKYFEPATYLQQHRKLNSAIRILSEAGKITLVPLLIFVLWLIFGYR
jgi:hypothetical protein